MKKRMIMNKRMIIQNIHMKSHMKSQMKSQMKRDEEKEYELAGDNFSIGAILFGFFVGLTAFNWKTISSDIE